MSFVARDLSGAPTSAATLPVAAHSPERGSSSKKSLYDRGLKRAFDLCLVLFTAPVWLSVILFGALLTALDGHSPFYCQSRVGRDGKRFRIWKLRTMVVDADAKLKSYLAANPQACAEWNAHQKLKNDPRVTPVGRILRKTSLDELPQLFNVLFGDMSLVGPRPMMVCQEELYKGESYYDLRPGLTGLWQVSERNESCFVERVDFDDTYAANASLGLDLRVLAKTVGVVLRGTGY